MAGTCSRKLARDARACRLCGRVGSGCDVDCRFRAGRPTQEFASASHPARQKRSWAIARTSTTFRAGRWANRATPVEDGGGKTPRFIFRIDEQLAAAGLLLTSRQWLVSVSLAAVSLGLLSGVLLQSMVAGFLLATVLAIAGLRSYLPAQIRRRQERFANGLPQALQAVAASLRSGQTLVSAIDVVAQLQRDEVAFQFQRALAEVQFGATIEEALARVAERMKSEDLRWLVLTLQIHREIGGPLNQVVDAVAQTMATRAELRREVRVLATEGKLSAMVLVAVPFIAFAALFVLRREYLSFFLTQPLGFAMLGGFAALMLTGWLWLQSILKEE